MEDYETNKLLDQLRGSADIAMPWPKTLEPSRARLDFIAQIQGPSLRIFSRVLLVLHRADAVSSLD